MNQTTCEQHGISNQGTADGDCENLSESTFTRQSLDQTFFQPQWKAIFSHLDCEWNTTLIHPGRTTSEKPYQPMNTISKNSEIDVDRLIDQTTLIKQHWLERRADRDGWKLFLRRKWSSKKKRIETKTQKTTNLHQVWPLFSKLQELFQETF